MKLYISALTLMLLCVTQSYSQSSVIDSLVNCLETQSNNDTTRLKCYEELSIEYLRAGQGEDALLTIKGMINFAEQLPDRHGVARGLQLMAGYNRMIGDDEKALEYYNKSLEIFKTLNSKRNLSKTYYGIGVIYFRQGNYKPALDLFEQALEINESIDDKTSVISNLGSIAAIYTKIENYNEARKYYHRGLKISEEIGAHFQRVYILLNLGQTYFYQSRNDSALVYYAQAETLTKSRGYLEAYSATLQCTGEAYFAKGDLELYYDYTKKALDISLKISPNSEITAVSYYHIAKYFFTKGNMQLADENLMKSLKIAEQSSLVETQKNIHELLTEIHERNGEMESALISHKRFKMLNDSLLNKDKISELTALKYEKQHEIAKQKQELKDLKADLNLKRQKIVRNLFALGFLLALLGLFLYLRLLKKKVRANKILTIQKEQLLKQNKQIESQAIELTDHKKNLELKVEERTKDLVFAKLKAEESDRLKTQFIQNISHEIRTPLNGIIGFACQLMEDNLGESIRNEYAGIVEKCSDNLLKIIENVLELSRLDSSDVKIDKSEFSLGELMAEVQSKYQSAANDKGTTLSINNNVVLDKTITSDRVKLKTIIDHLVDNAVKYTLEGTIDLGFTIDESNHKEVEIYVKDTGIGMKEDQLTQIFKAFTQVVEYNPLNYGGLGLGLAITSKYVQLLGGTILVESKFEEGSTFKVSIPVELESNESQSISAFLTENHRLLTIAKNKERIKVLLVDDDEINRLYMEIILNKSDLNVEIYHARNGREAVAKCMKESIDFIFMDLRMPIMDGWEATVQIKERTPDVSIVAQTAYTSVQEIDKAKKAGCDKVIFKPFNEEVLVKELESFIRSCLKFII